MKDLPPIPYQLTQHERDKAQVWQLHLERERIEKNRRDERAEMRRLGLPVEEEQ